MTRTPPQASDDDFSDIDFNQAISTEAPPPRWKRRHFERGTPEHALTWKTAHQRSKWMFSWQIAVMAKFNISHRVLRVAWLLYSLCLKEGYAYATDAYISQTLGIQLNHVQAALAELERAGAIVRASSFVEGKPQRRIWPSTKIIPPTAGGMDTPYGRTQDTPYGRGTDSIRKARTPKSVRIPSTQAAAKRDAELREQTARRRLEARAGEEAQRAATREQGAQPPWNGKTIDQEGNPVHPPPDPPQRLAYGPQFLDALETARRLSQRGAR
jgi:hypothetical protein